MITNQLNNVVTHIDLNASWSETAKKFHIEETSDFQQMPEVDAYTFISSPDWLNISLRPWQSVQIKTMYSLWPFYPPTPEEQEILDILRIEWHIDIDVTNDQPITEMVLVDGRRGGKSTLMSFIATYEIYSLICKYDPQSFYGLIDRLPIYVLHVAAAGDQAADMFQFTKNRMRSCKFFEPYFDWTKYNEAEMRIFTPYDLEENKKIIAENAKIPRGQAKRPMLEGSLMVQSVTTRAATARGKAIKMLIFSEFAHFARPKFDTIFEENVLSDETQQTDYAMKKALTPSVKDFKKDGRVLYESSPRERGGEFYSIYCDAGGMDQDEPEKAIKPKHLALLQLATWHCNPELSKDVLAHEFRTDPVGASMEYGARFGNPSGNFIPDSVIKALPQVGVPMLRVCNSLDYRFVVSVDPGGQAKKKIADTYVVSWGHYEIGKHILWLDGLQGWHEQVIPSGNGQFQRIPVDSDIVVAFIVDLIVSLGRQFVLEIVYDQWNSASAISSLQKMGFPALETFYTNKYKAEMYGNFLGMASSGQIKSYGEDINGALEAWKTELKFLQRWISGGTVYYSHPSSGPCIHDDYADSVANLMYRLTLLQNPTRQSLEDRVRLNLAPTTRPKSIQPMKGGNLAYKGASFSSFRSPHVINRIKGR